jgi:choline dehydrogenase-like flavoprotein
VSTLVRGERPDLAGAERALRFVGLGIAALSLMFAAIYVVGATQGGPEFPFTTNSIAKDGLLAALGLLVFVDVRRWGMVGVPLLVGAHLLLASVLGFTLVFGATPSIANTWWGWPHHGETLRAMWAGSDVGIVLVLLVLNRWAIRARYDLQYLTPAGFRAVMAMAEVLVLLEDREITPAEVANRVDVYLASFRAQEKWKIRLVFIALAYRPLVPLPVHPPLWVMSHDARLRWVRRHFLDEIAFRRVPEWWRRLDQTLIRTAQQFCFFGYYGDERAAAKAGYLPFTKRDGSAEKIAGVPPARRRVHCLTASAVAGEELTADVVIAGTGAGGAMLAYELARRGREVLMLERGAHIDPSDFTENEATQLSNLYADGALTLSKDFKLQVAQGMCVGGSTVVNNAVCFDLPDAVLERWLDPRGLNAGLDPERLRAAFLRVRRFLDVRPVGSASSLNPGARRIVAGLADSVEWPFHLVEANIRGCLGCGYCNIGCRFGKKLSALDWTLPRAQEDFPDAVRILPDCRVEKVLMRGSRASGVAARLSDGTRIRVRADTVVLSAGAIASSLILQRSGLGSDRAGRRLAFNVGSPVTLEFAEALRSEEGLQISHYLSPAQAGGPGGDGLAIETWFNPIVTQSLFMPGWFEEHWNNMRRYHKMTCLGVVVGTESDGSVSASRLGGVDFKYAPSDADFTRIKNGVRLAAKIGLAAGARRAMPTTFSPIEVRNEAELARIELEIGDDSDLSLNTSHPQGGNVMSLDALKGVVDPSFRVYGTLNVHVCDASVFPSSITVNPQLTVMALAAYAADEIAGAPADALAPGVAAG